MDKTLILNKIKEYKNFKSDADFARFLEIPAQNLSKWKARNTYDIEILYTKCTELNPEWLLTGEGEMLKSETILTQNYNDCSQYKELAEERAYTIQMQKQVIENLQEELAQLKKQTKYPISSKSSL